MVCDLKWLEESIALTSTAPSLEQMGRRTLSDKGIEGATAAHVLETLHTPLNFAYVTFTTGSSAFQNIVGVVEEELPQRKMVAERIFNQLNIESGSQILFTYAPLVNVFSKEALSAAGMTWAFLEHSSRDDLMLHLLRDKPSVVIGESTFIRTTLDFIKKCKLLAELPTSVQFICAGTPLDLELVEYQNEIDIRVHDLYGCQEFGWLFLNGQSLRDDITLMPLSESSEMVEVIVGGLPMGDSFPLTTSGGHVCNKNGQLLTYKRQRTYPEFDVVITSTQYMEKEIVERCARTILRIKGRVVRVDPGIKLNSEQTSLSYVEAGTNQVIGTISSASKLSLFQSLLEAQHRYQTSIKNDPTWIKRR